MLSGNAALVGEQVGFMRCLTVFAESLQLRVILGIYMLRNLILSIIFFVVEDSAWRCRH
jgi:hypothetical protein